MPELSEDTRPTGKWERVWELWWKVSHPRNYLWHAMQESTTTATILLGYAREIEIAAQCLREELQIMADKERNEEGGEDAT